MWMHDFAALACSSPSSRDASSLRYHLGLLTPNSPKCFMTLDGVEHSWFDGEELLFDQSYLHSAVNQTDNIRVILFCDVEKTQLLPPSSSWQPQ
jgi:beta-hydroxylase